MDTYPEPLFGSPVKPWFPWQRDAVVRVVDERDVKRWVRVTCAKKKAKPFLFKFTKFWLFHLEGWRPLLQKFPVSLHTLLTGPILLDWCPVLSQLVFSQAVVRVVVGLGDVEDGKSRLVPNNAELLRLLAELRALHVNSRVSLKQENHAA